MSNHRYSHPVSPAELRKWGVFTTMEVRNHNQEELAYQGSREFIKDVSKSWNCEISWKSCAQNNGHLMALCVPECLPERLALLSAICDLSFLQDDIFENTTDAQRVSLARISVHERKLMLTLHIRRTLHKKTLKFLALCYSRRDFHATLLSCSPNLRRIS